MKSGNGSGNLARKRHGKVSGDKHRCNISSVLTGASVPKAAASYSGTRNLR